jgi:hypothetical protein
MRALAIASLCVGGMVLARTVDDRALGDELRSAARSVALSLGRWPGNGKDEDEPADLDDRQLGKSVSAHLGVPPSSGPA